MEHPTIKVLLVEDDSRFARTLRQSLAEFTTARIELTVSGRLEEALRSLREESFEAILVDLSLGDREGLAAFGRVQAQAPTLPVVILADFDNEALALRAVREGAQDYLVKSRIEGRFLSRVIRYAIERKRTEEALRESEQRYRRLLASTTDYIYTVEVRDGTSQRARHGAACVNVTGYTAEEYNADPTLWYRMIFAEDRPLVTEQVTRLLSGQTVRPLEHRIAHKNGSLRWIRNTPVPRKDARGVVISYDGLISDITERKEAEGRLSAQCAVTRALAEAASVEEGATRILRVVCESLGWDLGAFWRLQPETGTLGGAASWRNPGWAGAELEACLGRSVFAKGEGLFGEVWETGKPAGVSDPGQDPGAFPQASLAARAGVRAVCGFPVAIDGHVLGVIGTFSSRARLADEAVVQMMGTIGAQIGQFMLRKKAEEVLAEERNLLRTLIDTLPDAIYVKDTDSRFVLANLAVAQLMGASRVEDLCGRTDAEFYPAELASRYGADERQVFESGRPLINREEPVIDATGAHGWLLTTKAPLRDLQGRIIGLVGIGRDITQWRREEEEHRLIEARLQAILANTPAVIYVKDGQGRYQLVNGQFQRLFGVTPAQVVGQTDFELFPAETAQGLQSNDRRVFETREAREFEEVVPSGSALRTYISIKFPLCDAEGRAYAVCGISSDITERKRAETQLLQANLELVEANLQLSRSEDALRQALAELQTSHEQVKATQLQLIQAEKLESIGTLAAGVAHEVKNPLQTILMGIAYLSQGAKVRNGQAAMVLNEMREAIKRADSIVRGLVEFSSSNHPEVQDEALNTVVADSLALLKYELTRHRVVVVKELAPDLPLLKLERNKVQQAFLNLFLNAIQAMPDGGTLTVRTHAERLPDAPTAAESVVVEVEDTGVGIPKEALPRVFDPFFTTKAPGVGSGLGLPVTRKIIELHGGAIDVANRDAGGARFSITFHPKPRTDYDQETSAHC
jgi:PAS domain S-box-containing protein